MTYAELLKNPDRVTEISWRELHEWVQQYPYVQGLRLLAVRKAKLENNADLQPLLELAATYSPNRRYLYDFLQQPRQFFEQDKNQKTGENTTTETETTEAVEVAVEKEEKVAVADKVEADAEAEIAIGSEDGSEDGVEKLSERRKVLVTGALGEFVRSCRDVLTGAFHLHYPKP